MGSAVTVGCMVGVAVSIGSVVTVGCIVGVAVGVDVGSGVCVGTDVDVSVGTKVAVVVAARGIAVLQPLKTSAKVEKTRKIVV